MVLCFSSQSCLACDTKLMMSSSSTPTIWFIGLAFESHRRLHTRDPVQVSQSMQNSLFHISLPFHITEARYHFKFQKAIGLLSFRQSQKLILGMRKMIFDSPKCQWSQRKRPLCPFSSSYACRNMHRHPSEEGVLARNICDNIRSHISTFQALSIDIGI